MKYGAIYPSLKGRTVLVTGGGSGIGEAIVRHFAAQGAKVGFIDIKDKESKALVAAIRRKRQKAHFEHCDLTDIDAIKAAITDYKAKHGAEWYAEIGRKGGQATKFAHGSTHYAAMGRIGGSTPKRARAVKSGGAA